MADLGFDTIKVFGKENGVTEQFYEAVNIVEVGPAIVLDVREVTVDPKSDETFQSAIETLVAPVQDFERAVSNRVLSLQCDETGKLSVPQRTSLLGTISDKLTSALNVIAP